MDRGARADAIEESWYGWQEGEREICPECGGARLNPLARAVRLQMPANCRLPSMLRANRRWQEQHAPTIETFGQMSVAAADEFFRGSGSRGGPR